MNSGREKGVAIYALTRQGALVARRLAAGLAPARLFLPRRLRPGQGAAFVRLADCLRENWPRFAGHLVVAAAGIVVRALAPLVQGKERDPAVVVVDQEGRFAVSLLGGHLAGANDLARRAAGLLGGQAVITTATDLQGLPSLELVARDAGLKLEHLPALAGLSAALLDGQTVPVWDPDLWLWPRLAKDWPGLFTRLQRQPAPRSLAGPLAWVDWRIRPRGRNWLVLRPPCLALGMGCNRGTSSWELEELVREVLAAQGLALASVACLASLLAKREEAGLSQLAGRLGLPLVFYSADQLRAVKVPNPSPRVMAHMGTGSVCEAAAILASKQGSLLVEKHSSANATLAVALAAGSGS